MCVQLNGAQIIYINSCDKQKQRKSICGIEKAAAAGVEVEIKSVQ